MSAGHAVTSQLSAKTRVPMCLTHGLELGSAPRIARLAPLLAQVKKVGTPRPPVLAGVATCSDTALPCTFSIDAACFLLHPHTYHLTTRGTNGNMGGDYTDVPM